MEEGGESWLPMTGDIAAMFSMIEMAQDHFKFIPKILLVYNNANPINNYKVSKKLELNYFGSEIDIETCNNANKNIGVKNLQLF